MTETFEQRMERENAERAATREQFNRLASEVATALGATYHKSRNENHWSSGDGHIHHQSYSLWISYQDDRIVISGRYPSADGKLEMRSALDVQSYDERNDKVAAPIHKMTVAPSKGASQIAKEIARRILPGVMEYTRRWQERDAQTNSAASARDATVARLRAEFSDAKFRVASNPGSNNPPSESDTISAYLRTVASDYLSVSVAPGGRVRFEAMTLDADAAMRVLSALGVQQ